MEHSILTLIAVFRYRRIMYSIDPRGNATLPTIMYVHTYASVVWISFILCINRKRMLFCLLSYLNTFPPYRVRTCINIVLIEINFH